MGIKILNLDKCISKLGDVANIDMKPFMQDSARLVQRTAKDKVPVDTGRLKGSITEETQYEGNRLVGRVYTPVEYAPYIEFGVLHEVTIRPKNKKALYWKGAEHPVKKVVLPPRPAKPYMYPALEVNKPTIYRNAGEYIRKQLSNIAK
jgi:hypothetical protein